MNTLEDLLRETLADRARDVDGIDLTAPRPSAHRGQRWAAIATVAAVAAAILVAIVLVAPGRGTPQRHAGPATETSPPAGMQWVSYHGITLTVPEAWVVTAEACASAPDAAGIVWMDPNLAVDCSTGPPDSRSQAVVTLRSLHGMTSNGTPTTLGGRPAQRLDDDPGSYVLDEVDVGLSVGAPDPATVDMVLSSVEYTPVDHNGCTEQPSGAAFEGITPGAISLGEVRSGVVCEYANTRPLEPPYLLGSRRLTAADIEQLRTTVEVARPAPQYTAGVGHSGTHSGVHVYRLVGARGNPLTVTVDLSGHPVEVSDGEHRAVLPQTSAPAVVPNAYP